MDKVNKWLAYERGKRQLQMRNLEPREYEKRLAVLCRKLGIY